MDGAVGTYVTVPLPKNLTKSCRVQQKNFFECVCGGTEEDGGGVGYRYLRGVNTIKCECVNKMITIRARRTIIS